jgi:uncharacterized protein
LQPQKLGESILPDHSQWIIIDEVQRIPELLNEIHRLIEGRKLRFILTGSSARSLRRKGVNLLAGRALMYHMHPLVIQEIGDKFNLNHALQFGLLPAAVTQKDPRSYLDSYMQTYVREEVLQEGLTRNVGAFASFLETASFSQGQVLNVAEIARELFLNRATVDQYFSILEDLLIAVRVPPFTQRAKRRMIRHQKFYFFDTGVYRVIRPRGILDTENELDGPGLETLFLQSVRALNDYLKLGYKIFYWRTEAGAEVDFVLYGPRGFHAFEIKRSLNVSSQSLKGLRAFANDYPEAKLHFLYLGSMKSYQDGITAYPFAEALTELVNILS